MDKEKENYYLWQLKKIDDRRIQQLMMTLPVIYSFGEHVKVILEYPVKNRSIDIFLQGLDIGIEIDEQHHRLQRSDDDARQSMIKNETGIELLRVDLSSDESGFSQLERHFDHIQQQITAKNLATWELPTAPVRKSLTDQGYSENHIQNLNEARIPNLIEGWMSDLTSEMIEVGTEDIRPININNGEMGFSVFLKGVTLKVSVRSNESSKLLVTSYDQDVARRIKLELDGPKMGSVKYWNIVTLGEGLALKGRFPVAHIHKAVIRLKHATEA